MFSCEYCEIFKNSFFYRTSLVAASGVETLFVMYNFKTFENSKTETYNLMISVSVDSGHLGKYTCEIPHEYL